MMQRDFLVKTTKKPISTNKLALIFGAVFALGMLAFSPKASATPTLTFGDARELGTVTPDNPQGDADRVNYVNFMLGLALGGSGTDHIGPHKDIVTRTSNVFSPLPAATTVGMVDGTGTSINLHTFGTFDYLFAHYGGPHGGTSFVWDISSLRGIITIPGFFLKYGLSGWSLITPFTAAPTPDGGATIMLLGLGLSALGMVRPFLKS